MYASKVSAANSTWRCAINAAAARRFWKLADVADFVSALTSIGMNLQYEPKDKEDNNNGGKSNPVYLHTCSTHFFHSCLLIVHIPAQLVAIKYYHSPSMYTINNLRL